MPTSTINGIPVPAGTGDGKDVVQDLADLANHVDTRVVSRYDNEAARNAANPSAIDGQFVYAEEESMFSLRRNSAWYPQMIPRTVMKTVNESVTSSTTLQNDNELFFYAEANSTYLVEYNLQLSGGADTGSLAGMKVAYVIPSGSTPSEIHYVQLHHGAGANRLDGTLSMAGAAFTSGVASNNIGTAATGVSFFSDFVITIGSTPGNVQLQWAQLVSNATAVIVYAGSHVTYTKIS